MISIFGSNLCFRKYSWVFERLKSFLVAFTQTEYLVILYNFVRMNGLDVPVKSFYYFREIINNIEKYKSICIKKKKCRVK